MDNNKFERKTKEKMPVLAICYDFDKTLSPTDMQAQGYIQSVGFDVNDFWTKSNDLAEKNDMDGNLAYMYMMKTEAGGKVLFTKDTLAKYGAEVELFDGVKNWFKRITEYGKKHGVIVEHYIISSGLKEMIEGNEIYKSGNITKVYASSFYYDDKNVAVWPAQVVNYTNKTQFLFRIEKGVLDINDPGVNEYFSPDEIRVPFRNMVYIGDSDTDIPCMKLVNSYGGNSIAVYDPKTKDKTKAYRMMNDNRIKFFAPADYSTNSEIDKLIKNIIIRTAENEKLETRHFEQEKELENHIKSLSEEEKEKSKYISQLEESPNFITTHTIIKKMSKYSLWSDEQKELMFDAAINNHQIFLIIKDIDILTFYKKLLKGAKRLSENGKKIKCILEC